MVRVFLGAATRYQVKEIEYPMVSARTLNNRKSSIVKRDKVWFLDSGAYTYLRQYGNYPMSYGQYLRIVENFRPNYWANMDWCCEKQVRDTTGLTVNEHISNTIESGRQLIDFDSDTFVMVMQGWKDDEYLKCVDMATDAGLITDVIGIGSICGRRNPRTVYRILKAIKDNLPSHCKLHGFGISLHLLKYKAIKDIIDSVDTFAWTYDYSTNVKDVLKDDAIRYLKIYQDKINTVLSNEGKSLNEYKGK